MIAQRSGFSHNIAGQPEKLDINLRSSPQNVAIYEAGSLTSKGTVKSVHQHTLNSNQQYTNKKNSTDGVRLRTTITPKTPDRIINRGGFGVQVQKAEKFNSFLCRTIGAKSSQALKDKLSKELSDQKSNHTYDEQTAQTFKPQRNPQLHRLNAVKSAQNLFDNTSSFQQYERLNEKINRNKQMIEQLRKNTRKDEPVDKPGDYYLKNIRVGKSPVFVDLEKKKQHDEYQLKKKIESANTSPKFQTASIDSKISSTPLLQKKNIEANKTPHNSFTSIQDIRQKHHLLPKTQTGIISIDEFNIGKKLGEGKYGVVYMAIHRQTRGLFAIKMIPKSLIKTNKMINQYSLEIRLQSSLTHGNILPMYGFFDDKSHLYMVLEYMEGGTLYSKLKKEGKLTERDTANVIRQITLAIEYLHDMGIAHRDIKPENIVIADNVCRLCDFGWAVLCTDRRKTYCGTFDYVAPQILQGIQYDMSVDLWCLGVMTFELLTGKAPFYNISRKQTMKKILNIENQNLVYPVGMSENAKDFLDKLIRKNPQERIKAGPALQHPFLLQVSQN